MRAAILLRVSTEEQSEQNISIPAQKSRNQAYCESKGWKVHDYYVEEGYSGKDLNRPEIQRLISDAQAKKFDVVLVWKLDRLSRRQQHIMYLIEDIFLANGIEFASVTENIDTSTAMGRAMIGIMAVFAQLERETIIERTKMGKEEAAKQGRYYGGPPLFGYRNNPVLKNLEINPAEAAVVQFIYGEYLKGEQGYQAIADTLNERGVPSPSGKSFWYVMTVRRILQNPVYAGYIRHHETLYRGRHDPIIPEPEFKQVQRIVASNRKRYQPTGLFDGIGLLRGIAFCRECGARLRLKSAGTRKGVPRLFYICYSVDRRARHMIADENCPAKYQNAAKMEQKIIGEILKYSVNPSLVRQELDEMTKRQIGEKSKATFPHYLQTELEDTKRRMKKWQEAFELGAVTLNEFCEHTKDLRKKRLYLENQLEDTKKTAAAPSRQAPSSAEIIEQLQDFQQIWSLADDSDKRRLVLSFIKTLKVSQDGTVTIKWQ